MADENTPEIPTPDAAAAPTPPVEPTVTPVDPAVAPVDPAVAPAQPVDPAYAAPPAPKKRKVWPFLVGGGVVLILVIVGIIVGVVALLGAFGGDPKKTVTDYDLSFKNSDCDLFTSTTTDQFQDSFFGGDFSCDDFVENADALTVDGVYAYDVTVVISSIDGDTAEVVTNEVDSSTGEDVDFTLRYYLVKDGGNWLIDGIENETPE